MARRESKPGEPRSPYAVRLGQDERNVLEAAASARGVPTSAFVRTVALEVARRELSGRENDSDR